MTTRLRTAWKAGPNLRTDRGALVLGNLLGITVHWPGGGTDLTGLSGEGVARTLRTWQAQHRRQDWADIGYNFLISGDGDLWEGCGWYRGAHAGSGEGNRRTVGVQLITGTNEGPTPAQLETLRTFRRSLLARAPQATAVYPHSHWTGTECPGDRIRSILPQIAAGKPTPQEDDMPTVKEIVDGIWSKKFQAYNKGSEYGLPAETAGQRLRRIGDRAGRAMVLSRRNSADIAGLKAAVKALGKAQGLDDATVERVIRESAEAALKDVSITLAVDSKDDGSEA